MIKKTLIVLGLALLWICILNIPFNTARYQADAEAPFVWDKEAIITLMHQKAVQYNVSYDTMYYIVSHEDPTFTIDQQSYYRYKNDHKGWGTVKGDREQSFGLVQIHLPAWPEITKEQATDPAFAIDFLASHLKDGDCHLWTTCPK